VNMGCRLIYCKLLSVAIFNSCACFSCKKIWCMFIVEEMGGITSTLKVLCKFVNTVIHSASVRK
jgi:hypothetical protein